MLTNTQDMKQKDGCEFEVSQGFSKILSKERKKEGGMMGGRGEGRKTDMLALWPPPLAAKGHPHPYCLGE